MSNISAINLRSARCISRLAVRLLAAACGLMLALMVFSSVAAGHAYLRGFHHLSPAACSNGCWDHGLEYYYRGGLWYCYAGGQWYYYDTCWHAWVSIDGSGAGNGAIVSASGW